MGRAGAAEEFPHVFKVSPSRTPVPGVVLCMGLLHLPASAENLEVFFASKMGIEGDLSRVHVEISFSDNR